MNNQLVLKIISQNCVGQNSRCFLVSGDPNSDDDYMSAVDHYKYHNGMLKIELSRMHLEKHQRNFSLFLTCKFFINKDQAGKVLTTTFFSKFVEVKNRFIYLRVINLKYQEDGKDNAIKIG